MTGWKNGTVDDHDHDDHGDDSDGEHGGYVHAAHDDDDHEGAEHDDDNAGFTRTLTTFAGASYTLNLDYAGEQGASLDATKIDIYVDGVLIGTHAGTSPETALNWEHLQFQFVGSGSNQTIRIVAQPDPAPSATCDGEGDHDGDHEGDKDDDHEDDGAFLDNLVLTEQLPSNTGYEDTANALPAIDAALADTDGSESLSLGHEALPVGVVLTDGSHSFTASSGNTTTDITGWTLDRISLLPPANFNGSIALDLVATATESGNGSTATTRKGIVLTVAPVNDPLAALASSVTGLEDTPYVRFIAARHPCIGNYRFWPDLIGVTTQHDAALHNRITITAEWPFCRICLRQSLLNLPLAHLSQEGDLDELILARLRGAGFPVVDGLGGYAENRGEGRGRQRQALPVLFEAISAKADLVFGFGGRNGRWRLFAVLPLGGLQLLLKAGDATLKSAQQIACPSRYKAQEFLA